MHFSGLDNLQKLLLALGDLTPSNTWFCEHTTTPESNLQPNGSAVFAGFINVTNRHTHRQTDHAAPSVAIGHI